MKKFNLIFFCQSIDTDDPIVADTQLRVLNFATLPQINKTIVITTRGKGHIINEAISTINLDIPKNGRIKSLIKLYTAILKQLPKERVVFYCYMTPTIPILVYPFKIFSGFKIATWFAHSQYRPLVKFNLKYISDLWFAPNLAHAKLNYKNLRIVGQAVDLDLFKPKKSDKIFDIITVGRLTPVKKIELIIEVVAYLKKHFQREISFCICGDAYSESDLVYKDNLIALVKNLNVEQQIHFQNSVIKENLPKFLNQSKVFVFPQKGSISKAVVEALSVGLPIIITEDSSDYLGEKLNRLFVTECKVESIAEQIKYFLERNESECEVLSEECRNLALSKGTQQDLFIRIVSEIKKSFYW